MWLRAISARLLLLGLILLLATSSAADGEEIVGVLALASRWREIRIRSAGGMCEN